jgi:hypothetical protein
MHFCIIVATATAKRASVNLYGFYAECPLIHSFMVFEGQSDINSFLNIPSVNFRKNGLIE